MFIINPVTKIDATFSGIIILNYKGLNLELANFIYQKKCTVNIDFKEGSNKSIQSDDKINIYFNDFENSEIELCLLNQKLVTAYNGNDKMQIGVTSIEKIFFDIDHLIISGNYIFTNVYTLATHINDLFEFVITIENNQFHRSFFKHFQYHINKLELINV